MCNDQEIKLLIENSYNQQCESLNFKIIPESIAHFIRDKFALRDSKFSEFMSDKTELSKNEIKGAIIFFGKGQCSSCHNGPHFSDFNFYRILYPQLGFGKNGFGIDYGRFNNTLDPDDMYAFRTPPLANVGLTKPYGHSGSVKTLKDAIIGHFDPFALVDFENLDGIRRRELYSATISISDTQPLPAYLDEQELDDLISFLETLTFNQ